MDRGPPVSINQLCLPKTDFATDLALARASGYDGISIDVAKLPPGADADLLAAFRASGLRAAACCASVWSILPTSNFAEPADPSRRVELIADGIARLAPFAPDSVFCATGDPSAVPGLDRDAAWVLVRDALRYLRSVAARFGTRLSLEPMTRQGGVFIAEPMVASIDAAVALFDDVGGDDLTVVVDVWHLFDSPGFLDQLRGHVARIGAVQVCDYQEPRTWRDRAMPGAGHSDVARIFGELDAAGYAGWLDLEVFSDELWRLPPEQFFALGARSIRDTWAARYRPHAT